VQKSASGAAALCCRLHVVIKNNSQHRILAFEMIIQRAFGDAGLGCYLIDADPIKALLVEQVVGGVYDLLPRSVALLGPVLNLYTH
jgi:hypothetical protein